MTIYGQIDSGIYSIKDLNPGKSSTVYGDGATFSPILGFKGSEDMGGGLKAGFDFQTDVQSNNGGENQNGQFRRQANGSLAGNFGEVKLGLTTNPIIATNSALMPTGANGNSVSTSTSSAMGYADFYTKNAVTYTSPAFMGLVAQVQKGMSNNLDSESAGGVTAWSLNYTNGPLALRAAHQDRKDNGVSSSSNASTSAIGTANSAGFDKKGTIMGASYAIGPVTVAAASLKTSNATVLNGARTERKGTQFGIGYTTGAWTLGGSLTKAEDSKMTNLQARYALSKRTNLYAIYGQTQTSSTSVGNSAAGSSYAVGVRHTF